MASDSTENLTLMMSGVQEIELLVKAEEEAAKEALRTISQVQKYHMTKGNEEGTVKILSFGRERRGYPRSSVLCVCGCQIADP